MALSSTIFNFDIDLVDSDRGVYESLSLRVARHPSESDEFLVARVLAYCLEYTDGLEFSRGLSDADEPPLAIRDLTGAMLAWIDVGTPSADRLHRASKLASRVAVYVHKESAQWASALRAARIHRAAELRIRLLDRRLVSALVERLDRRLSFTLTVSGDELFVSLGDETLTGSLTPLTIA